jgi:hypothetical protein
MKGKVMMSRELGCRDHNDKKSNLGRMQRVENEPEEWIVLSWRHRRMGTNKVTMSQGGYTMCEGGGVIFHYVS